MNTPATLFDKLWAEHLVRDLGGGVGMLAIDRVFCTMDHIVDTLPGRGDDTLMPGGKAFIVETRAAARAAYRPRT